MKFAVALLGLAVVALAQAADLTSVNAVLSADAPLETNRRFFRDLPADILRDFPGLCFASTLCRVFKVGEEWPLAPFCGRATCAISNDETHFIERVEDCGPLPKENPNCKIINISARNETFPSCCPQFKCTDGATLEYPTPAELAAAARTRQNFN